MNKFTIEIKWGFIFIIASLLWMLFEKAMGWHDVHIASHATYTNFFAVIAIGIYILALREKRRNYYEGVMSWTQGYISGLMITLVVTIFSPLTQYLVHEFITPDYFENVIAFSVENDQLTQDQAEEYFSLNNYILQSAVGAFVMGNITSALVALVMKRKPKIGI